MSRWDGREDIIEIPAMTYFDAGSAAAAAEATPDNDVDVENVLPPSMKGSPLVQIAPPICTTGPGEIPVVEDVLPPSMTGSPPVQIAPPVCTTGPGAVPEGEDTIIPEAEPAEIAQTQETSELEPEPEPEAEVEPEAETKEPENSGDPTDAENETPDTLEEVEQEVPACIPHESREASPSVAIIDTRIDNHQQLVDAANGDVILIDESTTLAELNQTLDATNHQYQNIEVWSHATDDGITLGAEEIRSVEDVEQSAEPLKEMASYTTEDGAINFFGCNVAQTDMDIAILDNLALVTDRTVRGSNNLTGEDGDFVLEYATDGTTGYESEVFDAIALEDVSVSLAFGNAGVFNTSVYQQSNTNGSVTLIFNRAYDSSNGDWVTYSDALAFAHSASVAIGGETMTDWHLGEWASQAEYTAWRNSFTDAEWGRFAGMIFAGFDADNTENNVFNDSQGRRYGEAIGGSPGNPNTSTGANYADWDTSDNVELTERGVVFLGDYGANKYENDPVRTDERGQLHDTDNSATTDRIPQDAIWIQTERLVGTPSAANTPSSMLIEQQEDGTQVGSVNPFENTSISAGSNAYAYQYFASATNWTSGQMTYTFDGDGISDSVEAKFNVSINNSTGNFSITAKSGQEPTASHMSQMLDGISLSITGSVDQPDITSITGNGTFTTKDIFGQNVTMADAGSYTILIEDRPDATPGTPVSIETGTGDRSGHDYLLITNTDYDLSAHGFTDISSPLDAHGIVMENDASGESGYDLATDGVFAWSQFELDSRDDNLSTFRMIVDNPDELFETEGVVRSDILFDPPANDTGTTFTVTLVHDDQTNTAYYEFTPVDDAVGMSAVDVDSYINSLTIDTLGEDPTPTKLTFSYTWTDVDGNFDQSIDGYQGDKPGSDADFGRTVVLIMPINDMPNPIIPPGADPDLPEDHVGFAIEEAGYILPFKDFTLTDADSTPGGIKLTMQNGWVEGDRYIEPTELSANNPKFDIAVDQTTGEVTITIKSGQTAETADYQAAVNGIQIKVADNQPDLTDIVGIIRVYDEVDQEMFGVDELTGDQYADASFTIGVKDRLEVSAGAPGAEENTGHDEIPDQILTDTFNELFPQDVLDDIQAIAVENGPAVNPFDDAVFGQRQVGITEINFEHVSGWLPGQIEWVVDEEAFAVAGIIVMTLEDGGVTFTPEVTAAEIDPEALGEVLNDGGLTCITIGENVAPSIAKFIITGEDGHTLTETSEDLVNNNDVDEDGVFQILQLGVNDAPVITPPGETPPGETTEVTVIECAIEGGDPVFPFSELVVTDIDSEEMQTLTLVPDGDVSKLEMVYTDDAQSAIDQYGVEVSFDDTTGWVFNGVMPIEPFNEMLQGIGFVNPDDDLNNEGSYTVSFTVTVLDVSETRFNDHLTDQTEALICVDNVNEPPPPSEIEDEPDPYRNIAEEDEFYRSFLDPELPADDPINVHISLFVRGLNFELEGQTDDGPRIIGQATQEVRETVQYNGMPIERFNEIILEAHSPYEDGEITKPEEASSYGIAGFFKRLVG